MLLERLKPLAIAVVMFGVAMFYGSRPAAADILITVSDGNPADTVTSYTNSNTWDATGAAIGGYSLSIETVTTNFPGTGSIGGISTTVNVLGLSGTPQTLTVTVQLVNYNSTTPSSSTNLLWTGPTFSPAAVTAGASFAPQSYITGGTVTTNTYFAATASPSTTGIGASTISADQTYNNVGGSSGVNSVAVPNTAGSYTLSQTVTLSGLVDSNPGAPFNFGGTSSVLAAEPSSLAFAGLGALSMIGFGLRRRRALGA